MDAEVRVGMVLPFFKRALAAGAGGTTAAFSFGGSGPGPGENALTIGFLGSFIFQGCIFQVDAMPSQAGTPSEG